MKHQTSRTIFEYWDKLRGSRLAPERADIDPNAIRAILAETFIIEIDDVAGHPFRLAGTAICGLFGRELKGAAMVGLFAPRQRDAVRDLFTRAAGDSCAFVLGVEAETGRGRSAPGEVIFLPLRNGRFPARRALGTLALLERPDWVGAEPAAFLVPGTTRYLEPSSYRRLTRQPEPPGLRAAPKQPSPGLGARRFFVIEGGRR